MYKLDVFENARNAMIKKGLIKDKPTSFCKEDTNNLSPCLICSTDAMCTEVDIESGKTKQTFYKGYKKHQMVGLIETESSLRYIWILQEGSKCTYTVFGFVLKCQENRFSVPGNTLFNGYAGPTLVTLVHLFTLVHLKGTTCQVQLV